MDLFEFMEKFPGECECLEYYIAIRKKTGIICRECGCKKHTYMPGSEHFECNNCKNRIGIKSGTAMENSKLPIKYWFLAIYLLTSTTETFTITEIQQKIKGADQKQVYRMLERLNECLSDSKNENSFDQLLLACVAHHNHPPATDKAD